jgi:hypothetical protein
MSDHARVPLSERIEANARLLAMMLDGETRLSRAHLRSLLADMRHQAIDVGRLELRAARSIELDYLTRGTVP